VTVGPLFIAAIVPEKAPLTSSGAIALAVVGCVFAVLMARRRVPLELLFLAGLTVVTLTGVITPAEALAGFSSRAVLLIAALFAAVAGLRATGALDWVGSKLLGSVRTERAALWRLLFVLPVSSVVLNSPLVAMLVPVVVDWCRSHKVSPSRLLIPLSYLVILGGVTTLIGTSTTLVVNAILGDLHRHGGYVPAVAARVTELEFFEVSWVGIPVAVAGALYVLAAGPRLLPDRSDMIEQLGKRRREYLLEMLVQPSCPMVGKTVEQAGLRHLPGLFLIEIDRDEQIITPVAPSDTICAGDRMVFTGVVKTIADLERIPGFVPAADMTYEFDPKLRRQRRLTEAVLSRTSPLIGRTVKEANFRRRYNAAVVAVHRNGERLPNKVGDIRLEPGDTLLLQTTSEFVDTHRNSRDFFLVSAVGETSARRHDRALVAAGLFVLLIGWLCVCGIWGGEAAGGWGHLLANKPEPIAAVAIVLAMIATRCMTTAEARGAIDLQVVITIAAAIGVGKALDSSGAASYLATSLVQFAESLGLEGNARGYVLLAIVYLLSSFLTEMITNVAVATMMIPIAISVAVAGGNDPRTFIVAVALAASLSFSTPVGYQTNLMVMGPGGYQPRDYLRIGLPLTLITATTAILLLPVIWPFEG
jgi:di/tricarboxylate transporter